MKLSISAPVKVLLLNYFGFNLAFYMLLPYLAKHITDDLGLTAGFAGFVMGFRMFSQQGLFLVGGTLADRFNYQWVIMIGCLLRVVGFALFGVAAGPALILLAAFMTGFAGALFTPACQALMARLTEDHAERERVFALQNVMVQSGMFLGPLAGMVLLKQGFQLLGYLSATIFLVLLVLQWHYLPRMEGCESQSTDAVFADWKKVFSQKDFVMFCFIMSMYYVMFNQIYILLPLSVADNESVAAIFSLMAVVSVALQMSVNRLTSALMSRPVRLGLGMALMALAFPVLIPDMGSFWAMPVAPLVSAGLLGLGMLIVFPPAFSMIPELGRERHQGVCFGVFYLFAGIAGASGGGLSAWFWERHQVALLWGLGVSGLLFSLLLWSHTRKFESTTEQSHDKRLSAE